MEILKKIVVHSPDTEWMMKKKLKNGRPILKAGILKIIDIYDLASQQYVYAYMALSQLLAQIYRVRSTMQKLVGDFESLLATNKMELSDFNIPVRATYEVQIGMPLIGELVGLFDLFDRLNCLLSVANKLNLFRRNHQQYFRAISKNRGRIHKIFLDILTVDYRQLRLVTIQQYLNKDPAYLKAAETMGVVRPAALFGALNIGIFPWLPTQQRNQVFSQLKKMAGN